MIMVCALDGRTWFKLPGFPSPVLNSQSRPLKNLTLSAHFLFQQLPRVVVKHMISQLHLPCPLFYETKKKILTSNSCLLEKKKAFLKEGSKASKQEMDFQDDAWKRFHFWKKKKNPKKNISTTY